MAVLAGGVVFPAGLNAQSVTAAQSATAVRGVAADTVAAALPLPDFEVLRTSDPRLDGYNAAWLYALPVSKISLAEVSFDRSGGGFVNYHQSDDSQRFGAATESFYRVSPRTVMYGKLEYGNFRGRNMGGSVFIDPYYNPFDLVEWGEGLAGDKRLESYRLAGAVGSELVPGLRIGGKIDYLASNYTKFKDLRHKNTYMDMTLSAGLSYRFGRLLEAGANYIYRRSTESIIAGVYGNTNISEFYILVDYGGSFGKLEGAAANYIADDHSQLMFNDFHGGSLQLMFNLSPSAIFFNEFTYKSRNGYYGRKSPSTVVHTGHDASVAEYRGDLRFGRGDAFHAVVIEASCEKLANYENIRREEGSAGSSSDIIYYGQNETLLRTAYTASVAYECRVGMRNYNPVWAFGISADYWMKESKASYYPYYRKQDMNYMEGRLSVRRNIFGGRNIYGVSLSAVYGSGGGTAAADGLYAQPSESQREPDVIDRYLYREFEYLTAARIGGSLGFRFTTSVTKSVMGYASVEGSLTKGLNLNYIGNSTFGSATLKIGCLF